MNADQDQVFNISCSRDNYHVEEATGTLSRTSNEINATKRSTSGMLRTVPPVSTNSFSSAP